MIQPELNCTAITQAEAEALRYIGETVQSVQKKLTSFVLRVISMGSVAFTML